MDTAEKRTKPETDGTAEKRQSETDGVSSTSVGKNELKHTIYCLLLPFFNTGGGKNVTSTPFVLRGHHVTTAPLDDSLFDPTAAPCCTNSLNEMSSIAELSESSSTITHTDITNIESEVSSLKDYICRREKQYTGSRILCNAH